jgi:hypothetical protein
VFEWAQANAVTSGAGGDPGQVQFHGATGLVDGADNVYFDDTNNRLGIGSAIPRTLLDVVGVASFRRLEIAGITTTYGLLDINGGGQANTFKVEDLTQGRVTYAGAGGELQDSANLTFDGDGLTVGYATITKLKVTGVGTIGNIEIAGSNDNVITTTLGNLTLVAYGGTVASNDPININDDSQSNNFNTGSFITQGGGVFNKNVIVGGALSHYGPTYNNILIKYPTTLCDKRSSIKVIRLTIIININRIIRSYCTTISNKCKISKCSSYYIIIRSCNFNITYSTNTSNL